MNTDALVLYVIDRSGSMGSTDGSRERATCDGFNGFKAEQANVEGNCYISICLFDDKIEVPYTAWNARDLPDMSPLGGPFHYFARGWTALRDAMGTTILGGEQWLANNRWFDGRVLVCVLTDGKNNASHQWSPSALRELVSRKQAEGRTFIFQGADDSWLQAADLGVQEDMVFATSNTSDGFRAAYAANSLGTTSLRTTGKYAQ